MNSAAFFKIVSESFIFKGCWFTVGLGELKELCYGADVANDRLVIPRVAFLTIKATNSLGQNDR